jgi:hypothetical protein
MYKMLELRAADRNDTLITEYGMFEGITETKEETIC